jgi:hypothetical protein
MSTVGELRERRQAELQNAAGELVALNARLGIQSTLQTTMPTTGPSAFIGVATGHAVVRIDQLEWLADGISEALRLANEMKAELDAVKAERDELDAKWERRWEDL